MSQEIHRLTDNAARKATPAGKPQKLSDGAGLYLLVEPGGAKYWRMAYRFAGKQKLLALGVYPDVTLKAARIAAMQAREKLRNGIDPSELRRLRKTAQHESSANSFSAIALEWFAKQKPAWAETHRTKVKWMLEKNLFPWTGSRPIAEITPPELLTTLRRIEGRGAIETAKRVKQVAGQVFRFAIGTGRAQRDPSQDLRGALTAPVKRHLAAITDPKAVGPLLLALNGYNGSDVVRGALRLAPLTFVRPGELRQARWTEIDFEAMEWRLPAERMKARLPHIVPLSTQAVEVLRELHPITGHSEYLFPSPRSPRRPMSNNAVLAAMRRLGIEKDVMCGHGFRAMARTIMDEVLGYRVDWIEHQLAHAVKDVNGRAYNRTAHLEKRKEMMQGWANYLDVLRERASGGNVVAIRSTGN
jgi:integrase